LRENILKRSGPGGVTVAQFAVRFLGDLPEFCAKADARHATAVLALAIARFQAKYGRFPEKLDALVPEFLMVVPRDPFDGKPMRYRPTNSGVLIYSVGRDMIDDAATSGGPKRKPEKDDMTFELPRWNP
jgi:hypothetical protein